MARRMAFLFAVVILAIPLVAVADWDPSQPAKWVQYPDETTLGIDVSSSDQFILADDFLCTETGYITDIHIWGSWLDDYLPYGTDPNAVVFTLSIHADVPAGPGSYSMPGEVLWYRRLQPGEFTSRIWVQGTPEGWMNPPEQYFFPGDYTCWQYNFFIPPTQAFHQLGSSSNPIIYWLDVKAEPLDGGASFGWKTSLSHWNDDAVWGMGLEPYFGPWYELRYPAGHEYWGQSIDLAFVITGQADEHLDWGDAPDSQLVPRYPTLAVNNGANHMIGGPWLGDATDNPDTEADGQPTAAARGDDNNGVDDEDGVKVPALIQGRTATIKLEISGAGGCVDGWIDWACDGAWQPADQVIATGLLAPGIYNFAVTVPPWAFAQQTFARFRVSTAGGLMPWGAAMDGEVEDYEVYIHEPYKWLQGPDVSPTGIDVNASEPYILADDFLCTEPGRITEIVVWGSWVNDYLPYGYDPSAVEFTLSFHRDIPAWENPDGYSIPGVPVWIHRFPAGNFVAELWRDNIEEGWLNPPQMYWFPADHQCYRYTFYIPAEEAFFQAGSEAEPIVYWLDVQATPLDYDAQFGWKTSLDHWNDDAVWGQGLEPYFGPWRELRYPTGHVYAGQSMDLAFALRSDPTSGAPVKVGAGDIELYQNQPNPFSSATTIQYVLPAAGRVSLEVFDITGRSVSRLVDEDLPVGEHSAVWNGRDAAGHEVAAGVYFCRLAVGERVVTRTMMLLK
ncbi:MAG: GEVED domain-containing protein [bacterium]